MKKQDLQVCQANSFIESRQDYTVNEKRLLSTIISFVKPTDEKFIEYKFSISEWAELTGKTKDNYYQIADSVTDGLMSKIIKVNRVGKDGKKAFKKFHVMSTGDYESGLLTLEISKDMNDIFLYLSDNGNYTQYELMEFITLTSTHAQRIYELVKQYQKSKHRKRPLMKITELKEKLGIEDKYPKFVDFRRKVLEIAEKQIHEKTNLRYKWKVKKRGRSYYWIEFYEIHEAGKESPTDLQEKAFLENYAGEQIYNQEINNFITIKKVRKNKNKSYTVIDKFDEISYKYANLKTLQECIAKAQMQGALFE